MGTGSQGSPQALAREMKQRCPKMGVTGLCCPQLTISGTWGRFAGALGMAGLEEGRDGPPSSRPQQDTPAGPIQWTARGTLPGFKSCLRHALPLCLGFLICQAQMR